MSPFRPSLSVSCLLAATFFCLPARAQYAVPPAPDEWETPPADTLPTEFRDNVESAARLGVGPALRLSGDEAFAGLGASLDLGRTSGIRLQGAWTNVGREGGEQHYGADLWLFLGSLGRLQPFVGAGAALVRSETLTGFNDHGVATIRATLDYTLPFAHTDARLGVDAILNVPAIDAEDRTPSALFVSRLGLGL